MERIIEPKYGFYVPSALKNVRHWVLWKLETGKNGKLTKVPKIAGSRPLSNASKTNPDHWSDYDSAQKCFSSLHGKVNGLGIVLTASMNVVFIDIDHCVDPQTRQVDSRGQEFLDLFPDTFCELSQSGTGLHFFVIGKIPRAFNNRDVHVEMYADKAYCAITGNAVQPYDLTEHQKEIDYAFSKYKTAERQKRNQFAAIHPIKFSSDQSILSRAMQNRKFADLYRGEWKQRFPSQSEADLCLCSQLAFWCERDAETVDRIFRCSALYRPKWDERHGAETYGQMTVSKACSELAESFTEWKRKQQNEYLKCFLSE